eukprot:Clim_evm50s108 gene=Clim_evmTU50s108
MKIESFGLWATLLAAILLSMVTQGQAGQEGSNEQITFHEWRQHNLEEWPTESAGGYPDTGSSSQEKSSTGQNVFSGDLYSLRKLHTLRQVNRDCKSRKAEVNHASSDCGAYVLRASSGTRTASGVLDPHPDTYMNSPCGERGEKRWVVIELCEQILVNYVEIANLEFFSSMFQEVAVFATKDAAEQQWIELGRYHADNVRKSQTFYIEDPQFPTHQLRIEFIGKYGHEYYCPVSQIKVTGTTFLEEIQFEAGGADDFLEDCIEDTADDEVDYMLSPPVGSGLTDAPLADLYEWYELAVVHLNDILRRGQQSLEDDVDYSKAVQEYLEQLPGRLKEAGTGLIGQAVAFWRRLGLSRIQGEGFSSQSTRDAWAEFFQRSPPNVPDLTQLSASASNLPVLELDRAQLLAKWAGSNVTERIDRHLPVKPLALEIPQALVKPSPDGGAAGSKSDEKVPVQAGPEGQVPGPESSDPNRTGAEGSATADNLTGTPTDSEGIGTSHSNGEPNGVSDSSAPAYSSSQRTDLRGEPQEGTGEPSTGAPSGASPSSASPIKPVDGRRTRTPPPIVPQLQENSNKQEQQNIMGMKENVYILSQMSEIRAQYQLLQSFVEGMSGEMSSKKDAMDDAIDESLRRVYGDMHRMNMMMESIATHATESRQLDWELLATAGGVLVIWSVLLLLGGFYIAMYTVNSNASAPYAAPKTMNKTTSPDKSPSDTYVKHSLKSIGTATSQNSSPRVDDRDSCTWSDTGDTPRSQTSAEGEAPWDVKSEGEAGRRQQQQQAHNSSLLDASTVSSPAEVMQRGSGDGRHKSLSPVAVFKRHLINGQHRRSHDGTVHGKQQPSSAPVVVKKEE